MCKRCASLTQGHPSAPFALMYQAKLMSFSNAQMRQSLETITATRAKELLTRNSINRQLKPHRVAAIKNDIKNNNFRLTHQGIALDWHGNILDGQHRLVAIAETGIPVKIYVTYNCDPAIFNVIDSGSPRNSADVLKVLGADNHATAASAIRLVLWAQNRYAIAASPFGKVAKAKFNVTNTQISTFYEENSEKINCYTRFTKQFYKKAGSLVLPSAATAFLFLLDKKYGAEKAADAGAFLERIQSGAQLAPGSVELALFRFLSLRSCDMRGIRKGEYMLSVFIRGYNRYLANDMMLQFRMGNIEPLPQI